MNFPNPHQAIDAENRERDRRVAALLREDPDIVKLGLRNLAAWAARWGETNPAWEEWRQLLERLTPNQLADFLENRTPKAERLRQSSPFLGVLQAAELSGGGG